MNIYNLWFWTLNSVMQFVNDIGISLVWSMGEGWSMYEDIQVQCSDSLQPKPKNLYGSSMYVKEYTEY